MGGRDLVMENHHPHCELKTEKGGALSLTLSDDQLKFYGSHGRDRHMQKDSSFRNATQFQPDDQEEYASHLAGVLGEKAVGVYLNEPVDLNLYDVRDTGEDFKKTEVKVSQYWGTGQTNSQTGRLNETDLKIPEDEFSVRSNIEEYFLCYIPPALTKYTLALVEGVPARRPRKDRCKISILGKILKEEFNVIKLKEQYRSDGPVNWVVGASQLNRLRLEESPWFLAGLQGETQQAATETVSSTPTPSQSFSSTFLKGFESYQNCVPPGVLLPQIHIEDKYYEDLHLDKDISNYEFLRQLCLKGSKEKKLNEFPNKQAYYDRVKVELTILRDLGFVDYILLNWDILNFCHENDIPTGPGRGSAAGSLVLYLIGVTNVDPVKHELFFERFVSKTRAKQIEHEGVIYLDGSLLADIDNDISYERRQEVIKYIENKHPGRTAKILTLNTLSSKLCIKECGKIVGGMGEQEVNAVSDMIPKQYGEVMPLSDAYEESEKFREWADANQEVYLIALKLEGLNKNTGVHPSGIAISHQDISDICPLQLTNDGALVTGYDMNWVSELMVKFDILGLRTLSVIYDVCTSLDIDTNDIDLDSYSTFAPLDDLKSPHGLFQLEADTNYRVCTKVKPKNLEQLSAVVALARPGALDFVDQYRLSIEQGEAQCPHEFFSEVLDYTGGIPLYQEQLMKMAVHVGFSLDEAEQLRRIVGKKKVDKMPAWKAKIESKVRANNLPSEVADVLWSVAEDSANYSFNKSHSIAYATLAAWTAYLKFTYPQQFFLSLLKMTQFEPAPQEEIAKISQELSFFDIELLPPDLVKSSMDFALEGKDIRYGLNSIKGVSKKSLTALRDFRESETPTKFDIFIAAKQAGLNIGIVSALIQAGALSSYKTNRSLLVLEAQAFNVLTDREKRNILQLGEKYNYKLLDILVDARDGKLVGDDGRLLMTEKRFSTFKKKYVPYRDIYNQNKKYEKFANWYFETQLLGYSYSTKLKNVFAQDRYLLDSREAEDVELRREIKFIGTVEDSFKSTSRNGNDYLRLELGDDVGTLKGLFMNGNVRQANGGYRRIPRLDDYINDGNKLPEKGNIVMLRCTKGEDVFFIDELKVLDKKIYLKLSDLK